MRRAFTLPLERHGNHLIVAVLIQDKPARLLLDTGASTHVLSTEAADRLGVVTTGRIQTVVGIAAKASGFEATLLIGSAHRAGAASPR
jgi:predicted aspartyl protease